MHSDEFLKAAGQDERLLEWAGRLTLKEGLFSLAERVFSKLLHLRGKPEDFAGLSTALIRQKRFAEAEELLLQSLLKISAPSYLLFCVYKNLGWIAMEKKSLDQALEHYNRAHTIRPHSLSLLFHRGVLFLRLKDYQKSSGCFQELLSRKVSHSGAWLGLALSRKALGERELAQASLLRALDFNPRLQTALSLKNQWQKGRPLQLSFSF